MTASTSNTDSPGTASPSAASPNSATLSPARIPIRFAATLVVIRDHPAGLQTLMLQRRERQGDLHSRAYVFPGGTVDAGDRDLRDAAIGDTHGAASLDAAASQRLGLPEGGLDFYLAAIRESFEEAGLLFASAHGQSQEWASLDAAGLAALRRQVRDGELSLAELCRRYELKLTPDDLAYHSHWLTPPSIPKRFDTRFFIAVAPAGQEVAADSDETEEHRWMHPAAILAADPPLFLPKPTQVTLQSLVRFTTAAECMAHFRQQRTIAVTMPRIAQGTRGPRPVLPHEPAYAELAYIDPDGDRGGRYELEPGRAVRLSERVWRVTAPNPSVMTGPGTNTYLIRDHADAGWTVIDPGPDDAAHLQAIQAAVAPGRIDHVLVTHTHRDHSPGAALLKQAGDLAVAGRTALHPELQDPTFAPDRTLQHGDVLRLGPRTTLRVLHTPGHASNHLCYLLEEEKTLFTGDHIMQGSTVVITPPDGDMAHYVESLRALFDEDLEWLAPGHGFLMADPRAVVTRLLRHRALREARIVALLDDTQAADIDALLPRVYDDVKPAMLPVARRSLLANLLKLQAEGKAEQTAQGWRALA